jgi:hypothetical protein
MRLAYTNTGTQPRALIFPATRASVEVDVVVHDERGELVAQIASGTAEVSSTALTLVIEPGKTIEQELVLDDFVKLGAGQYSVRVERARLNEHEPRLRSNEVTIRR